MTDIDRCRAEQRRIADLFSTGHPDTRGIWQGITDWTVEELIIMSDQQPNPIQR